MSTRTAKTTAKKTEAKPAPKAPARRPRTRPAKAPAAPKAELPTRPRTNTSDWMTDLQGYATLHALLADITTPNIQNWHDHGDGTATRSHDDGLLHYQHNTRTLTWIAPCPRGAHHTYVLAGPGDFQAARRHLGWCADPHNRPKPVQPLARALGDNLTRSHSAADETQPMSRDAISAVLQAGTNEQPKEHPQP